jgi:tetratricopeptide (TPR) repeat protein
VAQIHLALEQYPDAAKALERWFENTNEPNSHAYYLLAVAYYQQSKHEKALEPAKKAVEIAKKPNQSWLQMLVGLYLEQERFADALPHVEVLVTHFPRKNYYTQLSALYAQLELEEKSLAIMQLAYQQGFLTLDRELRRLGEMYLYHGLPQRAAGLMEKAFDEEKVEVDAKSLELLGNSFLMARDLDKAVDPLSRAAELSEEGEIYIRLGQIFLEREDWNAAADALSKGIERGVKKEGDAQLLLGIAYYNQNESKNAWRAFRAAREFEKSKVSALRWIEMLERDEARAAELEEFS